MGGCASQKRTKGTGNLDSKSQQSEPNDLASQSNMLSKRQNVINIVMQPPQGPIEIQEQQEQPLEIPIAKSQIAVDPPIEDHVPSPPSSPCFEADPMPQLKIISPDEPEDFDPIDNQDSGALSPAAALSPVVPDESDTCKALQVLGDMNCDPNEEFEEDDDYYIRSPNQTQNFFVQGYRVLKDRNANDTQESNNKAKPALFINCEQANQENYASYFHQPKRKL